MKRARGSALSGLPMVLLLATVWTGPASAAIKCWTNSDGVRECGNSVPPQYAQQGHTEKSHSGQTIKTTSRAKTQAELARERQEKERLAVLRAEEDRLKREAERRDRVLLSTYTTEEDLLLARKGQLAAIDSRIRHTEQILAKLQDSLKGLQSEAADLERGGSPVSTDLLGKIGNVRHQISENKGSILARSQEKEDISSRFGADLLRFRELKSTN